MCAIALASSSLQTGSVAQGYAASQPVGNLNGQFSVSGNGSATYSLDIVVPPGTAGAAPALQVTYDSHRGNGYLGMGWALNGISAITRCNANYRVDGYKAGVAYDARDRFCLDGRELVAVSGSYGADGAVYHTQEETWTSVTSVGRCGSGPCSFTAKDKDGNTLSFGGTTGSTGSRIPAQGRSDGSVRTWSIDSRTDLNGNAVTIAYAVNTATGEYYPASINYTSNAGQGLAAQRAVRFAYAPRPDRITTFLGGSQIQISQLLSQISTHVTVEGADTVIQVYKFAYSQSAATGRSRLDSVTRCDGKDVCWPPMTMQWNTAQGGFQQATPQTQLPGPIYAVLNNVPYVYGVLMDMNGDGIADYSQAAEFINGTTTTSNLAVYLGQPDGSFVKSPFSLPGPLYRVTGGAVTRVGILQDINGDGILDYSPALLNSDENKTYYGVYLGTGSGFSATPSFQLPGPVFWQVNHQTFASGVLADMNGDGIPDYSRATRYLSGGKPDDLAIYKGTGTGFTQTAGALPGPLFGVSGSSSIEMGILRDINGDGIADYSPATVNSDAQTTQLAVSLGQTPDFTFASPAFSLPGQMLWVVNQKVLESGVLVDMNGDGISDYSRATQLSDGTKLLSVQLGTGAGYTQAALNLPGPLYVIQNNASYTQGMLTDLNGDGTTQYSRAAQFSDGSTDLAIYRAGFQSDAYTFANTGQNLPQAMFKIMPQGTYPGATYQDVNGDGITDFVDGSCVLNGGGTLSQCSLGVRLGNGPFSDLLQSVTNGFKGETTISYAPLTSSIYTRAANPAYPIRDAEGPVIVVSQFANSDGRGNSYSYSYKYSGAQNDVYGFGWLGFRSMTVTEAASGRATKTVYGQTFPYYGLVTASQVYGRAGNLMQESDLTYTDLASPQMQQLGIHEPVRASQIMSMYTGAARNYQIETAYTYDGFGNVTVTADLGNVATPDDDVYSCTRYDNDTASNRLGYPRQAKTERTLAACQSFVAAADPSTIAWNPQTDLRWSKTEYDARMNVTVESVYDDTHGGFLANVFTTDGYGNLQSAKNAANATWTFDYDPTYHTFPTTFTSPQMSRNSTSYDLVTGTVFEPGFGVLVRTTDPNGNVTSQAVDGFGRPVEVYGPNESGQSTLLVSTSWVSAGGAYYLQTQQRPSWDNGTQSTWHWQKDYYDGLARVYQSDAFGVKQGQDTTVTTTTGFDAEGRVRQTSSPYYAGDPVPLTTTQYDEYNRPILTTDPAGVKLKIDYAEGGLKISKTSAFDTPDAQTTIQYITARGLVRQAVEPNGLTTNYGYDLVGQLSAADVSPTARHSVFTYDSLGRSRTATTADTGRSSWIYDAQGRLTLVTDAAGNTTSYSAYDALGRAHQRSMTYSGGTSQTSFTYDDPQYANGLGNLTNATTADSTPLTFSYAYGYTPYGLAKAGTMTIGGSTFNYASRFDPLGRAVQATYPDGSVAGMSYLTASTLGSVTMQVGGQGPAESYITYSNYTALGQEQSAAYDRTGVNVASIYYPIGTSFAQVKSLQATAAQGASLYARNYTWNKLNSLTQAADGTAQKSEDFSYTTQPLNQHMGFLTSATGAAGTHAYQYDQIGNLTNSNSATLTYQQNKDWLASDSGGTTFGYYGNGNMKSRTLNGTTWNYIYDTDGMLVRTDKVAGSATQSGHASYDYAGRQVFQQRIGESKKTYFITPFFEVVDLGNGTYQHTVYVPGQDVPIAAITNSGAGNTQTATTQAALGELYGSHSVWGAASADLHHGLAFLMSAQEHTAFLPAVIFACLLLFGASSAWRKRRGLTLFATATARAHPLYAALMPLIVACFLIQSIAPAMAEMVPGANGAGIPTNGALFFIPNPLESTVVVTDQSGAVTASVAYTPYGLLNPQHSAGTDNFRPKFAGAEWDPTTALYHMGMRQYAPELGRFLTPDPAGQYTNPYIYAGNNPASAIDPNGDFAFLVAMAIGAVAGAYFGGVAVNGTWNPFEWDWNSGKTYAGLFAGAAIGAIGAAAGGIAIQAGVAIGAVGGTAAQAAGIAVGIAGQALVGAGESAAFTALGGGSAKDVAEAALIGAAGGALFAAGGEVIGGLSAQFARRAGSIADAGEDAAMRRATSSADDIMDDFGSGASCSLPRSFAAGTPVLDAHGRAHAIETVKAGDRLLGRDVAAASDGTGTVRDLFHHQTQDLVTIRFASGAELSVTPEHLFRGYERGWIQAKDLGKGDLVEGRDGKPVEIARAMLRHVKPTEVYNFDVDGTHDYRVAADGVLVHNGKARYCSASYDPATQTLTRTWNKSELKIRFKNKSEYKSVKSDIRRKAVMANQTIASMGGVATMRAPAPVRTATPQWVRAIWNTMFPTDAVPKSSRAALVRVRAHPQAQDVDEYLERILGGLTIVQGQAINQGPMNSFVNQTAGAATGAASRRVGAQPLLAINDVLQ